MHKLKKALTVALGLFIMLPAVFGLEARPLPFSHRDTLAARALRALPDQPDSCAAYANELLRLALNSGTDSLLFKANQLLGYAYYYKGDYNKSIFYYQQTLGTTYIQNHPRAAASVYNNLGINYEILDEYDQAIDAYLQSLLAEEKIGNTDGKYMSWINLGALYQKILDTDEAKRYELGALRYFEAQNDSLHVALCHQNLGVIYIQEGQHDSAMIYNQLALDYCLQSGYTRDYIQILFNSVVSHLQQGNPDLARFYLNKVKQVKADVEQDSFLHGTYLLYQGRLFMELGESLQARKTLSKALSLLRQSGIKNYQLEALDNLLKSYVPASLLPEYKRYMEEFRSIRSDIFSQEVASNLSKAKVEFDVAILEKNLELEQTKTELHQKLIQGLLIILTLITLAAIIIYLLWQKQRRQNRALFQLNQNLTEKWKISNLQAYQKHSHLFQDVHETMEREQLYANPDLTIEMLAKAIGSNQRYVSECINTHHGSNFFQFVNTYRIEHAKHLLLHQPELTMDAIAESSGFSSRSTFYRAFKKMTGMSPGSYAEQGKQDNRPLPPAKN
jgi:AraC-like DNA-binding protein